jgi:O-antigen ligase
LSGQARRRMFSFSKNSDSSSEEALESSDIRANLLQDAVAYALRNPLFGLGPGNFSISEGQAKHGMWQPAHNSYVQVACECGFPAFFLFIGGIGFSFRTFWRIKSKFQNHPRANELTQAAMCMQLMMVMFCIAVGFLNFAYSYHFPLIVGISVAMTYATQHWQRRQNRQIAHS